MTIALHAPHPGGLTRLLVHCRLLGGADEHRPPAARRLEAAIGREQARLLVAGLTAGDHGLVRRARRRRVKSSP